MHYILTVLSLPSLSWFSICLLFLVFIFYHCLTFFTWPLNCPLLASLVITVPRTLNHTKAEEWEVLVTQYVWMPVTISPPPNLIGRLLYCPFPSSTPLPNPVSQQSCPGTGGAPWLWSETCLPVSYSAPLSSELLFLQESLLGVHMYWYISFRPTCLCSSVCSSVSIVFLLGSSPHCALHSPQILPTICNQSWSQELMSFMCLGSGWKCGLHVPWVWAPTRASHLDPCLSAFNIIDTLNLWPYFKHLFHLSPGT